MTAKDMTVAELQDVARNGTDEEVAELLAEEKAGQKRKGALKALQDRLAASEGEADAPSDDGDASTEDGEGEAEGAWTPGDLAINPEPAAGSDEEGAGDAGEGDGDVAADDDSRDAAGVRTNNDNIVVRPWMGPPGSPAQVSQVWTNIG